MGVIRIRLVFKAICPDELSVDEEMRTCEMGVTPVKNGPQWLREVKVTYLRS